MCRMRGRGSACHSVGVEVTERTTSRRLLSSSHHGVPGTEPRTSSLRSKCFTHWAHSLASDSVLRLPSSWPGGTSSCHLSSGGQWAVALFWVVWMMWSRKLLYSFLRACFQLLWIDTWVYVVGHKQSWVELTESSQTSSTVGGFIAPCPWQHCWCAGDHSRLVGIKSYLMAVLIDNEVQHL